MTSAPTRPATPELMWTTVPPAKSIAPFCCSQPPLTSSAAAEVASLIASGPVQNHTMCAIGGYADDQAAGDRREGRLERDVDVLGDGDALGEGRGGGERALRRIEDPL